MKPWLWAATAAVLLATAGCATGDEPLAPGEPTATLEFQKGENSGFGFAGVQVYSVSRNAQCTDSRQAARLLWSTGNSKATTVAAGHDVVVLASTYYYVRGGDKSCEGSARFGVEAGHQYSVKHDAHFSAAGCTMVVIDQSTGQVPKDLKIGDYANCLAFQ